MHILGFSVALCLLAGVHSCCIPKDPPPKRCLIAYRCSNEEAPVWTTSDDRFCEVFRNQCILKSQNCERVNQNKPEYREITKENCQQLCREMVCLAVFQPVCAIYNGKFKTFGNDCEMKRHICTTGETYSLYKEEACPE